MDKGSDRGFLCLLLCLWLALKVYTVINEKNIAVIYRKLICMYYRILMSYIIVIIGATNFIESEIDLMSIENTNIVIKDYYVSIMCNNFWFRK